MANNERRCGERIRYTIPTGVTINSGAVVEIGDLTGIAIQSGTQGKQIIVVLEGVYEVPKTNAENWNAQGTKVYWDPGTGKATTTAGSLKLLGHVYETAGSGVGTGYVRLKQS